MVTLSQDDKGNFKARKRLPADVRENMDVATGSVLRPSSSPQRALDAHAARQMFRDWETEVAGRIDPSAPNVLAKALRSRRSRPAL